MKYRGGVCTRCGTYRLTLHRDHIIPRWKGGSEDPPNIQLLCANCHEDKTRNDMTGKPISDAQRVQLRAVAMKNNWHTNHRFTPEARQMLSLAMRGKSHRPGCTHCVKVTKHGRYAKP